MNKHLLVCSRLYTDFFNKQIKPCPNHYWNLQVAPYKSEHSSLYIEKHPSDWAKQPPCQTGQSTDIKRINGQFTTSNADEKISDQANYISLFATFRDKSRSITNDILNIFPISLRFTANTHLLCVTSSLVPGLSTRDSTCYLFWDIYSSRQVAHCVPLPRTFWAIGYLLNMLSRN